jgi:[acyl-carrier-protein] S-malonyltransferase
MFHAANDLLGFDIADKMFNGNETDLKVTKITQPAVFLHSVIAYRVLNTEGIPDMVAGHSLGEFSALVANETLSFEDALLLVSKRATSMQKACEHVPSGMAVVLGLADATVVEILREINEPVVAANFNCPGQLVISGTLKGLEVAMAEIKKAGAKRVLPLNVGGAFHSPLMQPARDELARAIADTPFRTPCCPIYQNVNAAPCSDPEIIKQNLTEQLTSPVLWTKTIQQMSTDGATLFTEFGPGEVLQGLIKKIVPSMSVNGMR